MATKADCDHKGEAMIALAKTLPTSEDFAALVSTLDALDDRLALRTYLDGRDISVVDWLVWGAIKGARCAISSLRLNSSFCQGH